MTPPGLQRSAAGPPRLGSAPRRLAAPQELNRAGSIVLNASSRERYASDMVGSLPGDGATKQLVLLDSFHVQLIARDDQDVVVARLEEFLSGLQG